MKTLREETPFHTPSPVVLSSSCSVALGSNATPSSADLSYPYRKAILIDEIRFSLWADMNAAFNLGAFVYAKFQVGQHYLMRDPTPIWSLGTLMDFNQEQAADALLATTLAVSNYRWILPEPLYLEAGQVLRPVFNRVAISSGGPAGNVTVQVSYAGRVMPPNHTRPKTLLVPYAAPFVTTFGQQFQQSNEYQLFNPFTVPLKVQRLTGRVFDNASPFGRWFPSITAPTTANDTNVQIEDSWGGVIVDRPTGPGDVFDALRASWTFDTVMPPKGIYKVKAQNIPTTSQLHIAMIGTREEPL